MERSIIYSCLRALFVSFCTIVGGGLAIFIVLAAISAASSATEELSAPKPAFTPAIVANHLGERKVQDKTVPIILKLNISGVIGLDGLTRDTLRHQLIESREKPFEDGRVKAILLYIDSPGGTVIDADGIYREISSYKERYKVPVYAFVDGLAASGGMYITASADKIYASSASLIGSVGVIMPAFFNVYEPMKALGILSKTLSAGKTKDEMNPFRPWKETEEKDLQELIDHYYKDFVRIVSSSRPNLSAESLVKLYGARVFPAVDAKKYGYIDEADANIDTVKRALAEKMGVEDGSYQVVEFEKQSWLSELFSSKTSLFSKEVVHRLELPTAQDPRLSGQPLYLWQP